MIFDVSIFCVVNRIIHQMSYSHTSQQNGVHKRKYRYLLDVAHIIMIHIPIPTYLLSNIVLYAYHLINWMPLLFYVVKLLPHVFSLAKHYSFFYHAYLAIQFLFRPYFLGWINYLPTRLNMLMGYWLT